MMTPLIITCHRCGRLGHFAFTCPGNVCDDATAAQQMKVHDLLYETLDPEFPVWIVTGVASMMITIVLLLIFA